jgi:hypothetical protein
VRSSARPLHVRDPLGCRDPCLGGAPLAGVEGRCRRGATDIGREGLVGEGATDTIGVWSTVEKGPANEIGRWGQRPPATWSRTRGPSAKDISLRRKVQWGRAPGDGNEPFFLHNQWQVGNFFDPKAGESRAEGCFHVCTTQNLLLAVVLDGSQPL